MPNQNNINSPVPNASAAIEERVAQPRLRCGIVLRAKEDSCEISIDGERCRVRYASHFPAPRTERVSPGHLVAVARTPDGTDVVVWRWYDAVVVEARDDLVVLWEPSHGEVSAKCRTANGPSAQPGTRAYLSAGLPGAEWWVAGPVTDVARNADVELDEFERHYTENALW